MFFASSTCALLFNTMYIHYAYVCYLFAYMYIHHLGIVPTVDGGYTDNLAVFPLMLVHLHEPCT